MIDAADLERCPTCGTPGIVTEIVDKPHPGVIRRMIFTCPACMTEAAEKYANAGGAQ